MRNKKSCDYLFIDFSFFHLNKKISKREFQTRQKIHLGWKNLKDIMDLFLLFRSNEKNQTNHNYCIRYIKKRLFQKQLIQLKKSPKLYSNATILSYSCKYFIFILTFLGRISLN